MDVHCGLFWNKSFARGWTQVTNMCTNHIKHNPSKTNLWWTCIVDEPPETRHHQVCGPCRSCFPTKPPQATPTTRAEALPCIALSLPGHLCKELPALHPNQMLPNVSIRLRTIAIAFECFWYWNILKHQPTTIYLCYHLRLNVLRSRLFCNEDLVQLCWRTLRFSDLNAANWVARC